MGKNVSKVALSILIKFYRVTEGSPVFDNRVYCITEDSPLPVRGVIV